MHTIIRMLGITGALVLTTASVARAQEPVVRPQPLQADTTCLKWRPGSKDSTPTSRKALPSDTIADRRYRDCRERNEKSLTPRDSAWMRAKDSAKAPGTMPRKP